MINPTLIAAALSASIAFTTGWKVQGWRKDAQIAEVATAQQQAVDQAKAKQEALRKERLKNSQLSEALAAQRDKAKQQNDSDVTEARIEYVTKDPNATDCGLSDDGVRVWNGAAYGSGMPPP